jgi:hypothetical protein
MWRAARAPLAAAALLAALAAPPPAFAQPMMGGGAGGPAGGPGGMPDLRVINGKPLPDAGMAAGTVTVRVARKMPVNAVAGVEVTAIIKNSGGDLKKRTATTDAGGRAIFEGVGAGQQFQGQVVVDGETIKTTAFRMPDQGGIRTMLIAGLGPAPAGGGADDTGAAGGAGGDNFSIGVTAGTVESIPALPGKTLEVRAFDQKGKPVGGQLILLGAVTQGDGALKVSRGTTNAEGVARFEGLGTGSATGYAAVMDFEGMRLGTPPFIMPEQGGARAEIRALERTADPSVIRVGGGGRIIFQMHEDSLQVLEMLPLENHSGKIFDPGAGGVEIPLPKGFVNAEPAEGERKLEVRQNYGVAVHGAVAPKPVRGPEAAESAKNGDEVTFGFVVPYHGATHDFVQPMPNGLGATTLITEQVAGITINGPGIGPPEGRELNGRKYWLMSVPGIAPGGILSFTLSGLPSTDNSGRIAAAALALLLIAAAVVFGRRPAGAARKATGGERDKLLERREALFVDLVAAERIRRQALAGGKADSESKERRGALIAKLEAVYRDLAALDEQRAL